MARAKQLPRVHRYSLEFKLSAVRLSKLPGVQVQQVAEALDIHPFMLSRLRKQVREGALRGKTPKIQLDRQLAVELRQLAELQQRYALLKQEHELSKKSHTVLSAGQAQLDFTGPHEVLARRPGAECILASSTGGDARPMVDSSFTSVRRLAR